MIMMMLSGVLPTFITRITIKGMGVLGSETENNNAKWTLTAMEEYMRDKSASSVALGLLPTTNVNNVRPPPPATSEQPEESSPSWASSTPSNTPSFGSNGQAFEFGNDTSSSKPPLITTTSCTPEHKRGKSVDGGLELSLSKLRKSRKDSDEGKGGTPTRTFKLSKLLRRTHSAGCSSMTKNSTSQLLPLFSKDKTPVTKTKSADSAACSKEEGDDKQKKNRKTLAQDMKMRLSFLRRRHTDSSLQPSSVRPSPDEALKWSESFQELINSKYGLSLFRAFLSREFSEENIEFWLACEEYKRTRPNKMPQKAKKIYEDFVAHQAPKEVNLDSSMRISIQDHLQSPDLHSFDSAQRRIQGLMEQDAYVRFLQSDLYMDLAQTS